MQRRRLLGAFCALSFVLAACGRDSETTAETTKADGTTAPEAVATEPPTAATDATDTTESVTPDTEATVTTEADPCAGVTLEATETGITADEITVLVMADVGSELAPGLFQGNLDGANAWAKAVNANGGLACRQVKVIEWDSKINPVESTNGFLEACSKAAALVGSSSLFIGDVSIIDTCADAAGAPTGIADIAERSVDALHQCSPNVFPAAGVQGSCPYAGEGERTYSAMIGVYKKLQEIAGVDLHGIYLIPSDLPSTIQSAMPTIRAMNDAGYVSDAEFGVSGRAEQAVYAEYVAAMKTNGSNYAQNGSNDQAMIKLRTEAVAQGLDETGIVWACSLSCYTEAYQKDPNADGTWLWLPFLPFEERDSNPEIGGFLDNIGQAFPQSWAVGAWNSGRAFETAVNNIVANEGPNAITRAKILESMRSITDFTNNDWIGAIDYSSKGGISPCYVILQLQGGEYVRKFPEEVGTLDCTASNVSTWTGIAADEYKG